MRAAIGDVADTALARALARDALRAIRWLGETGGVQFVRGDVEPAYEFVVAPSAVGKLDRRWQGAGRIFCSRDSSGRSSGTAASCGVATVHRD